LVLALCACTVLRPEPDPAGPAPLAPGDSVRVTFADGRTRELVIIALDAEGFTARRAGDWWAPVERLRRADLARIERREPSPRHTVALIAGVVIVYSIVWSSSFDFFAASAL